MSGITPLIGYNLVVGLTTGLGLAYFYYHVPTVAPYRRLPLATLSGLVLFLVGGPIAELLLHPFVHWIHAGASVLVILGLYDLVRNNDRRKVLAELLLKDPAQVRQYPDWMLPIDEAILQLFHTTDLVLSPSIVAFNIDYSRSEVNRRVIELESRGFLSKIDRGKYRIDDRGVEYMRGPVVESAIGNFRSFLSRS